MNKAIIILPTDSVIFTSWIRSKIEKKFINSIFFFIDQHLYLSKKEIIKKINQIIKEENINISFFQGDYLSLDQIKKEMPFIKINNETPKDFVHQGNYVISWEK